MGKKVINKGYTITVTSWENDGDNSQTHSITVDTKEKAKAYHDLMQLCESENNQSKGVVKLGNACDFSDEQEQLIIDFLKANPILLDGYDDIETMENDDIIDIFSDITYELLGSSEWYKCRVMEECVITYSPKDTTLKEVKF